MPGLVGGGNSPPPKTWTTWRPRRAAYTQDSKKQAWGTCAHSSWCTRPGPSDLVQPQVWVVPDTPWISLLLWTDDGHTPCHHQPGLIIFHLHIILLGCGCPFFWGLGIGPWEHVLYNVGGCLCSQWHHISACPLQPSVSQDQPPAAAIFIFFPGNSL